MNDTFQTLIRSVLKIGGGYFVSKGIATGDELEAFIAAAIAIIGIIWGVIHRNKTKDTPPPSINIQGGMAALIFSLLLLPAFLSACSTSRLEMGGAYAPATTNIVSAQDGTLTTNVVSLTAPDIAFYRIDAAFLLAYDTIDTVFTFERNNRRMLWQISPDIKHTLDRVRPEAVKIKKEYALARKLYKANPVPAGLSTLEEILARINNLSSAVQLVIPAGK